MSFENGSVVSIIFLLAGLVLILSHIFLMPRFLRILKRYDRPAHASLNVAWLNILQNFTSGRMFLFLLNNRFTRYPAELHGIGGMLKYTWAYPLLVLAVLLMGMIGLYFVTGVRLDEF